MAPPPFKPWRRFQFLTKTEPVLVPPPVPSEDSWHQPWSEPVRKVVIATALMATSWTSTPDTVLPPQVDGFDTVLNVSAIAVTKHVQYQAHAEPVFVPPPTPPAASIYPWSEPVRPKPGLSAALQQSTAQTQFISAPVVTPQTAPASQISVNIQYETRLQYQAYTAPIVSRETINEDKWHYPWSEPVRTRQLATAQQQSVAAPVRQPEPRVDSWVYPWSDPVRQKPGLSTGLQQFSAVPPFDDTLLPGATYESPWHYPWSEPVRIRPQLPVSQQQSYAAPITVIEVITPDKWIYPWSEPVRSKPGLTAAQQGPATVSGWDDTVEPGATYESPWHFPWSEPVRIRQLAVAQQQSLAFQLDDETQIIQTYESRWHYSWSEPVRVRQLATAQQQAFTVGLPSFEIVTADKWIYPWSEPVRQKPGIGAALQQFTAQTVLDPDTQITQNFESRFHFPWAEPVRVKPWLATNLQQAQIQGFVSTPEIVTVDKWIYPWTEPVRQKAGLAAQLQSFIALPPFEDTLEPGASYESPWHQPWSEPARTRQLATAHQQSLAFVLDPNTQVTQTYESRWHFAWSEPVRVRQLATAQQQAFTLGLPSFEIITVDKWTYPWSEPVRQKPGLGAALQQSLIATTLDDETQIIQTYESRWHYAWSEPVRIRPQLLAGQQQAQIQGFVFTPEVVTVDKWVYPWSDPVRQKIGLAAQLQQALIAPPFEDSLEPGATYESPWHQPWSEPPRTRQLATAQQQSLAFVLDPNTQVIQTYESRWHFAWSEPVRVRQLATAQQQAVIQATSVFEIITVDKWFALWREPVREKSGLKAHLQQALIAPVLDPNTQITQFFESRWHQPWSTPVWRKVLPTAQQPALIQGQVTPPERIFADKWVYPWSEPVRQKLWLRSGLQQALVAPVLNPATQILLGSTTALSSPIFFRQRFIYQSTANPQIPLPNVILVNLNATEVNTDSALFSITVFNQPVPITPAAVTVVSIVEIPAVRAADASIEEEQAHDEAAASIKET